MFGQISDPFACFGVGNGYSVDRDAARSWFDKVEEHADDRCFAGAVGTEQSEIFALLDAICYVVDRRKCTEFFGDGIKCNHIKGPLARVVQALQRNNTTANARFIASIETSKLMGVPLASLIFLHCSIINSDYRDLKKRANKIPVKDRKEVLLDEPKIFLAKIADRF